MGKKIVDSSKLLVFHKNSRSEEFFKKMYIYVSKYSSDKILSFVYKGVLKKKCYFFFVNFFFFLDFGLIFLFTSLKNIIILIQISIVLKKQKSKKKFFFCEL